MPNETVEFFRRHLKTPGGVESFIKHLMQVGQQNVHTPFVLCREIVEKLSEYVDPADQRIAVLFNIEFLHVLVTDFGVPATQVTMFADDDVEMEFCRLQYGMTPGANLFKIDIPSTVQRRSLVTNAGECDMKFDVVVMNPPYQPIVERGKELGDGGSGSGCTLWDKFVPLALGLLNDGGHLCCVHPAKWRKPDDKLLPVFMGKRLLHLDIHNKHEGLRVFGATTRFDWYVLQNSPRNGTATTVRDEKGIIRRVDLGELPFIPNADFDLVARLLARDEDEKCRLLYDGATYDRRRPWMNTDQTGEFVYPCVNATGKAGLRCYYSNTRDKGLFGIPKVIFSDADIIANAVVDCEGEYGMTQHGMAIRIDSKREGQQGVGERPI